MFIILLLGVGGAYWLVTVKTTLPNSRGKDIIKIFRSKKLSDWQDTKSVQSIFTVRNHAGKIIGYSRENRWFINGLFITEMIQNVTGDNGRHIESVCGLTDDLSECYYLGEVTATMAERSLTETILKGDNFSVTRSLNVRGVLKPHSGSAGIPDNFIPDGALLPILRLVAQSGESAGFSIVDDEHVLAGGKVHFTGLMIEPAGPNTVKVMESVLGGTTRIFHLDENGEIKQIDMPEQGLTITREPVEKPEQVLLPRALLEMSQKMGWRLTPPVEESQ